MCYHIFKMHKDKINRFGRVGVLMGGLSPERPISFRSGKAVYDALRSINIDAVAISLDTENPEDIDKILRVYNVDVCFIAMHGRFGEDGTLQYILERLNVAYTGSGVRASRLSMDKAASREIFKDNGLCAPRYFIINKATKGSIKESLRKFKFPLVVKPVNAGSSVGLSIVEDKTKLKKAIDDAHLLDDRVMIEEYIAGRELTVGILDDESLPIIEIVPKRGFFSYDAKYIPGLTQYIIPVKLGKKIANKVSEAAALAHKSLYCFGCSRVDIILSKKSQKPYILEVNSIPGFTSLSLLPRAAKHKKIEFPELCSRLIESALIRYRYRGSRSDKIRKAYANVK